MRSGTRHPAFEFGIGDARFRPGRTAALMGIKAADPVVPGFGLRFLSFNSREWMATSAIERATIPSSLILSQYGSRIGSRGIIGPFCSVSTNPKRQYALRCRGSARAAFRLSLDHLRHDGEPILYRA